MERKYRNVCPWLCKNNLKELYFKIHTYAVYKPYTVVCGSPVAHKAAY